MKNKFLMIVVVIAVICNMVTTCFAEISFVAENGTYIVKGAGESSEGNITSVMVSNEDEIVHTSYAVIDDNGNFSYSFRLPENAPQEQIYTLEVATLNKGVVFTRTFKYANTEKRQSLISALNAAQNVSEAKIALEKSIEACLISEPISFALTEEGKHDIYARISETNDLTIDNLTEKIRGIFGVAALANAAVGTTDNILNEYASSFMLENEKHFNIYKVKEQKDRSTINEMFIKNEFSNLEELKDVFNEIVVLNEINSKESPGEIVNILKTYSEIMPESVVNLSDDEKLVFASQLLGETINTIKELDEAAKSVPEQEDATVYPRRQDSSSGRSGGFGGGTISLDEALASTINQKVNFADISDADWARTAINTLIDKKIMNGYENGDFRPNNNITREEFVKVIVNAFEINEVQTDCMFDDIKKEHWAYPYICTAKENGLINGISENCFGTGNNITRQDMVVIIANAMKNARIEFDAVVGLRFTDDKKIADYAKRAVYNLREKGIIGGYEDGSFMPQNNATRAEAAQMVYMLLKSLKKI